MTTRRAIGSYPIDATDEEKRVALHRCIVDAAMELAELVKTWGEVEDALEDAEANADEVFHDA